MHDNSNMLAISTVVVAVALITVLIVSVDGRKCRFSISRRYSSRVTQWNSVLLYDIYHDGWCRINLRCNMNSFLHIADLIQGKWNEVNSPIGKNAYFFHRERVAVTLHFLTHSGAVHESAQCFGMGKASALRYIDEVIQVILSIKTQIVSFPKTAEQLNKLADEFERIGGFPNVVGAIDGSLIEIQRPNDYEGWYCRKGYCAFNVQAVCDARRSFMSFSIYPGSFNDKTMFKSSSFGKKCHQFIPSDKHLLGDAGYTLQNHLMTPYDNYEVMPEDQRLYNYLHSKTRITVEGAFGILKQRFRVLTTPLSQNTLSASSAIIEACFVLHNVLINLSDDVPIEFNVQGQAENDSENVKENLTISGLHKREQLKLYLRSIR